MRFLAAALLVLSPGAAWAGFCGPDMLYFFVGAPYEEVCHAELPIAQPQTIEVYLETYSLPGPLAQVHFRAENWPSPGEPPQGTIYAMWSADVVAGELATGITLSWNEGLEPPYIRFDGLEEFHLGTIIVDAYTAGWVGPWHQVALRDVRYRSMSGHDFLGDELTHFTFNTGGDGNCTDIIWDPPYYPQCSWMLLSPPDGSTVGGDFIFRGVMLYYSCYGKRYTARAIVKLNGVQIGVHEADVQLELEQPVSVSGIGDGESFTITVETDAGWPCQASYSYTYTLDTTAAKPESFSAIKARY